MLVHSSKNYMYTEGEIILRSLDQLTDVILDYSNDNTKRKCSVLAQSYSDKGDNLIESDDDNDLHGAKKLYDKAIIYAVDDSYQLLNILCKRFFCYFAVREYEYGLRDCQRALKIPICSILRKCQLKLNVLDCLGGLRSPKTKRESLKTLRFIKKSIIPNDIKQTMINRVREHIDRSSNFEFDEESEEENVEENEAVDFEKLLDFEKHENIPCASKSIMVDYNEEHGRHITATRDIEPGEILVVEKSYLSMIHPNLAEGKCLCCYAPLAYIIPCHNCTFAIYCSQRCRASDWAHVHKYECDLPYSWYLRTPLKVFVMRFLLSSVHKCRSVRGLYDRIISFNQCSVDPFRSRDAKTVFNYWSPTDIVQKSEPHMVKFSCEAAYYLATKTNFYGTMYNVPFRDAYDEIEDFLLVAALILRSYIIVKGYLLRHYSCIEEKPVVNSLYAFSRFFNHSCFPNATYYTTKKNEIVIFSKHRIKKGSQIFISYFNDTYINLSKAKREKYLEYIYYFSCSCTACKKNWTRKFTIDMRKMAIEYPDILRREYHSFRTVRGHVIGCKANQDPVTLLCVKAIENTLKIFNDSSIVRSYEYEHLFNILQTLYTKFYKTPDKKRRVW